MRHNALQQLATAVTPQVRVYKCYLDDTAAILCPARGSALGDECVIHKQAQCSSRSWQPWELMAQPPRHMRKSSGRISTSGPRS